MPDEARTVAITRPGRAEQMFPALTAAQIARVAQHGRVQVVPGEVLFEVGQTVVPFCVVTQGRVQIVRPAATGDTVITTHGPGEFTGEVNMLSGAAPGARPGGRATAR